MKEWAGFILAVVSIVVSFWFQARAASRANKKLIGEQAAEKVTLRFESDQIKEAVTEMKELVKENYSVLAGQLKTLQTTMMVSDEKLGDRIDKVEDCISDMTGTIREHKIKIGHLQNDVQDMRKKVG